VFGYNIDINEQSARVPQQPDYLVARAWWVLSVWSLESISIGKLQYIKVVLESMLFRFRCAMCDKISRLASNLENFT
jgi:hypothetical protein